MEINELTKEQLEHLKHYAAYHFTEDKMNSKYKDMKLKVYNAYIDTIENLVAKYEVCYHDLHSDIVGLIELTFRLMTSVVCVGENDELNIYSAALNCESYLINMLYYKLIVGYIKKINKYRRIFLHFNYKGIQTKLSDGSEQPMAEYICEEIADIKRKTSAGYKKLKSITKSLPKDDVDNGILMLEFTTELNIIPELETAFHEAQELLDITEDKYPEIIGNGYKKSALAAVVGRIPEIVTVLIIVVTLIKYLSK